MVMLTCSQCQKTFERKFHSHKSLTFFCSKKCSYESRKKDKNAICPQCGEEFKKAKPAQRYCCRTCASNATSDMREARKRALRGHVEADNLDAGPVFYALFECPWQTGAINPDEYGSDMVRMPDFGCGF